MMVVTEGAENGSVFTLKEVNCVDGTHYYALLTEGKKAGVIDATGLIKAENVATDLQLLLSHWLLIRLLCIVSLQQTNWVKTAQ